MDTSANYTIPACNLSELEVRIAALNKRARRIGCQEIALSSVHAFNQREYRIPGTSNVYWAKEGEAVRDGYKATGAIRNWLTVTVTGEAPTYGGYTLVAVLEPMPTDDGKVINLMQAVPGETCPAEFRKQVGKCDHCNHIRKRNQTFVVRSEAGYKMVGRQCLKDFLGHANPHMLASWAELLIELNGLAEAAADEEWLGGGRGVDAWDLQTTLAQTAAVIACYGWVSGSAAQLDERLTSTRSRVNFLINPPTAFTRQEWLAERAKCAVDDTHTADAVAAIAWARSFTDDAIEDNNYLANCNAIARTGFVIYKTMGLAVSIVSSYQREQARLKLAELAIARSNEHVGVIKKRQVFKVTVERSIVMPDRGYGESTMYKLLDNAGNELVWFASSSAGQLDVGSEYNVKATVIEHSEYKGRKQTKVNRVTVMEPVIA